MLKHFPHYFFFLYYCNFHHFFFFFLFNSFFPFFHADIAIGAPYEVNGDSTGVVYIYYGSSNFTAFQQQTPFKVYIVVSNVLYIYECMHYA